MAVQTYILIPTHNRCEILCATIRNIYSQLNCNDVKLIIVDAGSKDGTSDIVSDEFEHVEIIKGHSDMWWTATVNHGINHIALTAKPGDKILLMNDDIELAPKSLSKLLEASDLNSKSVIGAANIINRPNNPQQVYFCGGHYDLLFARHKYNISEGTLWEIQPTRFLKSDFLYGRLLIIPWEVFHSGIRFDEFNFPQYSADEDFSYSAKLKGYQVLVDTQSVVYVNETTTSRFSLSFRKSGLSGLRNALFSFNSCYNFKQNWKFASRYAKYPILFTFCRYAILFLNENISRNKYKRRLS
jgi:GT2 family glycosyltransferase